MELQDLLRRRKMVRSFRPDPVPPDVIATVMESVLHAPSAGFTQGNEFLVLDSLAAIDDYIRLTDDPAYPVAPEQLAVLPTLVVFPLSNRSSYLARYSDPDKIAFGLDDPDKWPAPFWDIDAAMASMLILLTAIDNGLGGLFAGLSYGERELLAHFGVPHEFRPIGVSHLGYPTDVDGQAPPASAFSRRRRSIDQLLHHNGW